MVDEVLVTIFGYHSERNHARTVARRWYNIINHWFELQRFTPPLGRRFNIDFEIDRDMTKHVYTAECTSSACPEEHGAMSGTVSFLNWAPSFLRSVVHNKSVVHRLNETDVCFLWRLVSKISATREDALMTSAGNQSCGHLTMAQGTPENGGTRVIVGRLPSAQTQDVLQILDHRRNRNVVPVETQERSEDYLIAGYR
eukprot:gnl/MRDRNA2_/MRDRNA2_167289_c0_seq1.p1 gnl/MRDRNA2_/MRDRNA2_167289_c0~~gnl/MRDRNA2_/MRDRNA2_167289_c0_seq1.p1  ORF type:complete len:213 (+),score=26.29 gnl/MRDRNA2_/MRDRNA2_167289_c0_seq1:48-641(+)